jgi:hypothetical protein
MTEVTDATIQELANVQCEEVFKSQEYIDLTLNSKGINHE